ncbi:MAG: extracellular solute-binding protein [Lysobacterales bacterium]|jgi:arabinogalactan oligomer/maltooligosaccharide transport system substrate-binding protein|nr:MAG: extracellular solute-binding protein [Xanthomonadales bacterium]
MTRKTLTLIARTFVTALAGCLVAASAARAATELTVWHAYRGDEKAAFEKVVGMYNAKQKDAVVKTLAVPYDAYADKITASVPRGKGPDVFIFAQDRLGGWVEAGQTIEPIDFFVDDKIVASLVPGMMSAMTYRDTVYGLPLNYKSIAMIYNTALVKTPPKTTGELVKVAKGLTNAPSGRFGLAYEYSNFFFHAALMNAFGGQVFGPGAKPTIDSPQNVASVKQMLRWYKTDGILPADPSSTLIASLFNEGKAAIVFSGPWFLGEVQDKVKYAIAPLPTVDEAGGKPMKPWLTVEGVYVSAGSQHKEAAYAFAEFLVSTEAAAVLALEGGQLPTNKAVYADPRVMKNPTLQGFRKQLDTAVPMPNYAEMTLMWSPVTTAMNKIVKGSATPEVALKEAQATVTDSIAKLRKGK